jgi:hypothetical protein
MLGTDPDITRLMALRAIEGGLLRLKWLAAATRFEIALRRHARALKAGFNPDEPRDDRGRWTDGGGSSSPENDKRPKIPKERRVKSANRTAVLKTVARRLVQTGEALLDLAKINAWLEFYAPTVQSYNDPPKTLEELQRAVSTPEPGYDIHHIVEQTQAANEGYSRSVVNSPDNLVRIPRMKHWEINAWYQTRNPNYDWETPREYLIGRNWDVKRAVGLQALRKFGVLKP